MPYTLKKRDVIIAAVKSRLKRTTHKNGIEVPMSVEHAYAIDTKNGNLLWQDAVQKE